MPSPAGALLALSLAAGLHFALPASGWEFQQPAGRITVPVVHTSPKAPPSVAGTAALEPPVPTRPPAEVQDGDPAPELLGTCFSTEIDTYEYTLCPYANVTQKDTSVAWAPFWGLLGTYERWEVEEGAEIDGEGGTSITPKAFLHQLYTDGTLCGDMPRQTAVLWECGAETGISGVSEPTTCHYALTLTTPAACEDPRVRTWNTLPPAFAHPEDTAPSPVSPASLSELKAARCALAALAHTAEGNEESQVVLRAAVGLLARQTSDALGHLGIPLDPTHTADPSAPPPAVEEGGGEGVDATRMALSDMKRQLAAAGAGERVDAVRFLALARRVQQSMEAGGSAEAAARLVAGHPTLAALQTPTTCQNSVMVGVEAGGGDEGDVSPLVAAAQALVRLLGALPLVEGG